MRIGVLGSPTGWYWNDLVRGAHDARDPIELISIPFTSLHAQIHRQQHDVSSQAGRLDLFDAILVRSMPAGSLEQIIFRMDTLHTLTERGCRVINSPRALETAIDKYLSLARLQSAGFVVPPTVVTQDELEALNAFETLGGDVVVKPIFGSEGRGLIRLTDYEIARRVFRALHQVQAVLYVQQFIRNPGYDWRLLVIGDEVLGIQRVCENDWRANLAQGGRAEPLAVPDELADQARKAAGTIGAQIAAVDFLPGTDGVTYAIEVNAVPGWRGLAAALQIDVAARVLECIRSM